MSDSHYEPIQEREFKSTIPGHLLDKLSENERYMVQTMSRLENQSDWLAGTIRGMNRAVIDLDRRASALEDWQTKAGPKINDMESVSHQVRTLWDWRNNFTGKTGVALLAVTITVPVVLKFILDRLLK